MIINADFPVINRNNGIQNRSINDNQINEPDELIADNTGTTDKIAINARKLIAVENIKAAQSPIRDANQAQEVMAYTRQSILSQPSTALEAHTGNISDSVIPLIK